MTLFQYRAALRLLNWANPNPEALSKIKEAQPLLDADFKIWDYYANLR